MEGGVIVKNGDASLVEEINENGFAASGLSDQGEIL